MRLTAHQKLLVLDVAADRVETCRPDSPASGLDAGPSEFRRGAMACTGIEFCKLAIVETKGSSPRPRSTTSRGTSRLRRTTVAARQRLPQLVRAHPDRRHRAQGLDRPRCRWQRDRRVPGAPRRVAWPRRRVRPQATRSEGDQQRAPTLRRAGGTSLHRTTRADGESFAEWAHRAEEADLS